MEMAKAKIEQEEKHVYAGFMPDLTEYKKKGEGLPFTA